MKLKRRDRNVIYGFQGKSGLPSLAVVFVASEIVAVRTTGMRVSDLVSSAFAY